MLLFRLSKGTDTPSYLQLKGPIMNRLIGKLVRMFTAMAYAEAEDLDTVKQMLREDSDKTKSEPNVGECNSHQPAIPAI